MTDNEKRAHDLAVAMVPILFDLQKNKVDIQNNEIRIDCYSDYKKLYETSLESFNRDFPDGK